MSDVTVIGAGPNGLTAALVCARAGLDVHVIEAYGRPGGGARSHELLEPGFSHDMCAAVHPTALASLAFRELGVLADVEWIVPEASFVHVVDSDTSHIAWRDLSRMRSSSPVGAIWATHFESLVGAARSLAAVTLGGGNLQMSEVATAVRLGSLAVRSSLRGHLYKSDEGRAVAALLAGVAAHSLGSAASIPAMLVGATLATHAHVGGWPLAAGGSGAIVASLMRKLRNAGVTFTFDHRVEDIRDITGPVLLDVTPREAANIITGASVNGTTLQRYKRFKYGPAVVKYDCTMDGPVPWANGANRLSPTLHVGGTGEHLTRVERHVSRGELPPDPYMLIVQPTLFDAHRAPVGKHTLYAYVHVPAAWSGDGIALVEERVEALAPGFRDLVRARRAQLPADLYQYNRNYIDGDISSGRISMRQLLARPRFSMKPWRIPSTSYYLCSASTFPGPGVHGMGGWHAAHQLIRQEYGLV